MEVKEMKKTKFKTCDKATLEERIKKQRKEYEKLVHGKFEFIDAQGGFIDFTYRWFPGEPLTTIRLYHGETCDLPMGIVKHLNNTKRKIRKYDMVELKPGQARPHNYEYESRIKFTPSEWE